MMTRTLLVLATVAACGGPSHTVRFANAPAITAVTDRADVPKAPAVRPFSIMLYHFRGAVVRRLDRTLTLPEPRRSLAINALDEVPDSTWFTNRIGARDLAPAEIGAAPGGVGSPEAHTPWTIKSSKVGGRSIGFIIEDARGEKFVLKFDQAGYPETETATDAIVGRLLWAAGYNVPEDHVVYFKRTDLVLPAGATVRDFLGNKRPLTRADFDRLLAQIEIGADGRIRGLASKFIGGVVLGGHPDEGVRRDDPNDRVPHERRRDIRGARSVFAWLDHVDVKEDNTLDVWVADELGRHHVKHYLIDFGKALGTMALISQDPRRGHAYHFDLGWMVSSLATLGLRDRPWDGRTAPTLRGLGLFDSASYAPHAWKASSPSYLPFHLTDAVDGYWGAKLVMRFTRPQLRAAVAAGRLTDPRTEAYLVDTLVERQRMTGRYWFSQVAPLDRFAVAPSGALCFDDLLLTYELAAAGKITRYTVSSTDRDGNAIETLGLAPGAGGHTCTAPLRLAAAGDGYTIVKLRVTRHALDRSVYVHLARRDGATHVIGIWRP